MSNKIPSNVLVLIGRYFEDDLSPEDTARLSTHLERNEAARAVFVSLSMQRRLAVRMFQGDESTEPEVVPTPVASIPIDHAGTKPSPLRFVLPIAAALLVACGVAIYVRFASLPHSEIPDPTSLPPVATLIESTGSPVVYEDGIAHEGGEYAPGTYSIESGSAQFLLRSRVTVDLRGKTRLRMYNPSNVYLARGEAAFKVPKGVEGFTVHLPDESKIVDLGTAFRVEIDDDGQPQLHVTEGSVEWTPAGLTSGGEPVLIVAGQSAELVDGQPVVSQIVRLLGVDFQHTASASVGVTQAGFEAFDETDGGSATYSTAGGDVTVTMTGLDGALGGYYNRGGVTHDDELTFADLYNDFAFNNGPSDSDGNGSASMTLKLTGPGIAPNTAYELTFYSYDDDDTQGDHSVVYTGISGTSGVTEPLTWAGGVDPTSDNTYAVTATFTSDDSGILTIDMTDNWTGGMPNNNGNTGIRLSAFEITRRTPEVAEPDAAGPETDPEPVVAQNDLTKPLPTESETADR